MAAKKGARSGMSLAVGQPGGPLTPTSSCQNPLVYFNSSLPVESLRKNYSPI
jgi:hypothetical protein